VGTIRSLAYSSIEEVLDMRVNPEYSSTYSEVERIARDR